jgi:hypothetical protein
VLGYRARCNMAVFVVVTINRMVVVMTVDFVLARQRAAQALTTGQSSRFQDLIGELIKRRRLAEDAARAVQTQTSDNVAVALAQKTYDETTKAVGKVKTWVNIVSRAWFFNLVTVQIVINVIALATGIMAWIRRSSPC